MGPLTSSALGLAFSWATSALGHAHFDGELSSLGHAHLDGELSSFFDFHTEKCSHKAAVCLEDVAESFGVLGWRPWVFLPSLPSLLLPFGYAKLRPPSSLAGVRPPDTQALKGGLLSSPSTNQGFPPIPSPAKRVPVLRGILVPAVNSHI